MKKIFLLLLLIGYSYANTSLIISKINDGILQVDDLKNYSEDDLKVGALVSKKIGESEIVIARAKFLKIEQNTAKFELYVFSDLKQKALPVPKILPSVNDKLILNKFINHTILIAPNKKIYNQITEELNNFKFFNTDVLAAKVYEDSKIMPTRNDFRNQCKEWVLGSAMVVLSDGLYLFECSSLKKIAKLNDKNYKSDEGINFYSNISKNLDKNNNYFEYFQKLFEDKE